MIISLTRIELQVLYEEALAPLSEFRLVRDHPPYFHGGNMFGIDSLHLVWDN